VALVFASGKVVVTGCAKVEEAREVFSILKEKVALSG
jgi:TATA-box binding protein (TBP) (component of TFIID and TFIIIB)